MAGTSLLALLDDITTILDDVAAMTKVATKKTAGVLGDDLALNAEQVTGVNADRELPVVWAVAKGSAVNKLILVPSALAISGFAPWAVTPLLMIGGAFLCFEGCEKLAHKFLHPPEEKPAEVTPEEGGEPAEATGKPAEKSTEEIEKEKIKGAIRTDFVLSAEIIVISLGTIATAPFAKQVMVLSSVGVVMTVGVYGLVAAIVKLDDAGLALSRREGAVASLGRAILLGAPYLMKFLSVAGTVAMFLVGGGILAHGLPGVHGFSQQIEKMEGLAGALLSPLFNGVVGLVAGALILGVFLLVQKARGAKAHALPRREQADEAQRLRLEQVEPVPLLQQDPLAVRCPVDGLRHERQRERVELLASHPQQVEPAGQGEDVALVRGHHEGVQRERGAVGDLHRAPLQVDEPGLYRGFPRRVDDQQAARGRGGVPGQPVPQRDRLQGQRARVDQQQMVADFAPADLLRERLAGLPIREGDHGVPLPREGHGAEPRERRLLLAGLQVDHAHRIGAAESRRQERPPPTRRHQHLVGAVLHLDAAALLAAWRHDPQRRPRPSPLVSPSPRRRLGQKQRPGGQLVHVDQRPGDRHEPLGLAAAGAHQARVPWRPPGEEPLPSGERLQRPIRPHRRLLPAQRPPLRVVGVEPLLRVRGAQPEEAPSCGPEGHHRRRRELAQRRGLLRPEIRQDQPVVVVERDGSGGIDGDLPAGDAPQGDALVAAPRGAVPPVDAPGERHAGGEPRAHRQPSRQAPHAGSWGLIDPSASCDPFPCILQVA